MAKAAAEGLAALFMSPVQSRAIVIPSLQTTIFEPGSPLGPWSWGRGLGNLLPSPNFVGAWEQGREPVRTGTRARRRLSLALAAGASPLPGEVRAPRPQPVGGARPRGAGPRGWGLRRVYKAGAGLTSDLGLFIWGARGRRRLAAAVAAADVG